MKNKEIIIIMSVVTLFFLSLLVYNYIKFTPFLSGFITSDAVDPIFSVRIVDFESPVRLGEQMEFSYYTRGIIGVNGTANVNFWIDNNEKITFGEDVIYLGPEEKTRTASIFLPTTLRSGVYEFHLEADYNAHLVKAYRTIQIEVEGEVAAINPNSNSLKDNIILGIVIVFAILVALILYQLLRKNLKKNKKERIFPVKNFAKKKVGKESGYINLPLRVSLLI